MDFHLSEAQRAVQARARAFARDEVLPGAVEADRDGRFRVDLVRRMGELGLLAGPVPEAWGGAAMDYVSYALVYEELGYVDAAIRGFLAVHGGLVIQCLLEHGSEEQKRAWLPALAAGTAVGCYCLTEAGAGSDAAHMAATARRTSDGYVLEGEKVWITNGNVADVALVFARDPDIVTDRAHRQICAFVVPTDAPGLLRAPMHLEPLGHRAADHAVVTLDACAVPETALLGAPGTGFRIAMSALDHGRLGVAAGAVGLGQACVDEAVRFARDRHAFGQRIGDFGAIQAALADTSVAMDAARLLTYQAAWLKDQGLPSTHATTSAKLFATEAALQAADQAVLIHGSRGYDAGSLVARHWRDVKGMQIYEGTSHIQRLVIARELLGPPEG